MPAKYTTKNTKRAKKKHWLVRVIACVIIVGALSVSLLWSTELNVIFGLTKINSVEYDGSKREDIIKDTSTVVGVGANLNVHFVDVGQGDSIIIELPDTKKMIIDGGKDKEKNKLLTYIDANIREEDGSKINSFDYALLTHSDEDHCGGLDEVLAKYPAEVFYRPNVLCSYNKNGFVDPDKAKISANTKVKEHGTAAYSKVLTAGYNLNKINGVQTEAIITDAANEQISTLAPNLATSDPNYYKIVFYAPTQKYFADVNDYSPIIMLEYHDKQMVLSGDAEKEAEESFVNLAKDGKGKYSVFDASFSAEVIKLGHHGSKTSSSLAYLNVLTCPEQIENVIIIISCALVNDYGHPSPEILKRLKDLGIPDKNIISTATNSSIGIAVRGQKSEDAAPTYQMFVGADLVRTSAPLLSAGDFTYDYNGVVYTLIALTIIILLIAPILKTLKQKARSKQASRRR